MDLPKGTVLRLAENYLGNPEGTLITLLTRKEADDCYIYFKFPGKKYKKIPWQPYDGESYTLRSRPNWELVQKSEIFTDEEYKEIFI